MAELDPRGVYNRERVDFCPIHGRFMRPMSAAEWGDHVRTKH